MSVHTENICKPDSSKNLHKETRKKEASEKKSYMTINAMC